PRSRCCPVTALFRSLDAGFDPAGVVAFEVWLPFSSYDTRERAAMFYRDLEQRLRSVPGVTAVGFGPVPLKDFGTGCSVVFREGKDRKSTRLNSSHVK